MREARVGIAASSLGWVPETRWLAGYKPVSMLMCEPNVLEKVVNAFSKRVPSPSKASK